jgi:hypothetical protein
MSNTTQLPFLDNMGGMLAMLKDTLANDLIPNTTDRRGKAVYTWMLNMMNIFGKHDVFATKKLTDDVDTIFAAVNTPEAAVRFGCALSRVGTILTNECDVTIAFYKDLMYAMTQLVTDADTQDRDLGRHIRDGWNEHRASINSDQTM